MKVLQQAEKLKGLHPITMSLGKLVSTFLRILKKIPLAHLFIAMEHVEPPKPKAKQQKGPCLTHGIYHGQNRGPLLLARCWQG
jgi:hypothetical protein